MEYILSQSVNVSMANHLFGKAYALHNGLLATADERHPREHLCVRLGQRSIARERDATRCTRGPRRVHAVGSQLVNRNAFSDCTTREGEGSDALTQTKAGTKAADASVSPSAASGALSFALRVYAPEEWNVLIRRSRATSAAWRIKLLLL